MREFSYSLISTMTYNLYNIQGQQRAADTVFFFSAPVDASAEDESTHTTGNGVVAEVGDVQAHVHFLC